MNMTKRTLTTTALALTLTVGGATAALAGSGDDGAGRAERIAAICADPDAAIAKIAEHQAGLTDRLADLGESRATAEAAGRPKLAARIGKRIDRLEVRLAGTTTRLAEAPEWIAEHCS